MNSRASFEWRKFAAWLLLGAPFFAYPLVWLKIFRSHVPHWGEVLCFAQPVLALFALAVLICGGIGGLRCACGHSKLHFAAVAASMLMVLLTLIRCALTRSIPDTTDLFMPLVPLAGMVIAKDVLHILPLYGTLSLAVLVFFGFRFTMFTGFVGNWNWNLSLIAVLIPAPFILSKHPTHRRLWIGIGVSALFLAVFSCCRPELAPRGTIAGAAVAAGALWMLWKIPNRQRLVVVMLGGGAALAMFLTVWLSPADSANRSSRLWLWRGSVEFVLTHSIYGVGTQGYEREINPYLPKEYYFSEFATDRHTHPHNELLSAWSAYGLAGALFFVLFVLAASQGLRTASPVRVWAWWLFVVLSVHGQFDVLLATPLAGTLWLVVGGALAGRGYARRRPHLSSVMMAIAGGVILTLALIFSGVLFSATRLARLGICATYNIDGEEKYNAREYFIRSLKIWPLPAVRYRLGMVEMFDFRNPEQAIKCFEELSPGYVHSNGYLARAYAFNDDLAKALLCFEEETLRYPYSALNAFWELEVMKRAGHPENLLAPRRERVKYLLKLRGLTVERIDELIRNPRLDDAPLRRP